MKVIINLGAIILFNFALFACGNNAKTEQAAVRSGDSVIQDSKPDSLRVIDSLHKVSVLSDTSWSKAAKTMSEEKVPVATKQVKPEAINPQQAAQSPAGPKTAPMINPFRPAELLDGLKKAQAGNLAGAIEDFTAAIKKNPKNYNAYFYRSKARIETGDPKSAMEDINMAIQNKGDEAIYYYYRGKLYSDAGESAKAVADFNQAIRIKHDFTDALNYRGVERAKQGFHKEAIQDYDSAILANPAYPLCYYNKGTSQASLGDYNGAIASFTKTISMDAKHKLSYLNRGNCYVQLKNYKAAISDYTSVIQIDPKNQDAYYNRGAVYYLQGDKSMCNDWRMAASLGNARAKTMLEKNCK